jgi:hypothetical protein
VRGQGASCDVHAQALIWLQMFVATELLIFSARTQSYLWASILPSPSLLLSVFVGCLVFCLIAGLTDTFGALAGIDILLICAYDLGCLLLVDVAKVQLKKLFNESSEVLPDLEKPESLSSDYPLDIEAGLDPHKASAFADVNPSPHASQRREMAELHRAFKGFRGVQLGGSTSAPSPPSSHHLNMVRRLEEAVVPHSLLSHPSVELDNSQGGLCCAGCLGHSAVLHSGPVVGSAHTVRKSIISTTGLLHPHTPASLAIARRHRHGYFF